MPRIVENFAWKRNGTAGLSRIYAAVDRVIRSFDVCCHAIRPHARAFRVARRLQRPAGEILFTIIHHFNDRTRRRNAIKREPTRSFTENFQPCRVLIRETFRFSALNYVINRIGVMVVEGSAELKFTDFFVLLVDIFYIFHRV